jgi:hypothetical protein
MEGITDTPRQVVISEADAEPALFIREIDDSFQGRTALFFGDDILDEIHDLILMRVEIFSRYMNFSCRESISDPPAR